MNKKEREHWLATGEYPGNNNPKAIPKKPKTPKPKTKPQPKPDNKNNNNNNNNKTETSTADKLGSLSELAKLAAGDGLQGLDPSGSHGNEEGAVASIQYSTLDKEVDKKQNEIRRQIEALRT